MKTNSVQKGGNPKFIDLECAADDVISKRYKDVFYGKRRIAFILMLIATIFVYKATTILLAISTISEHSLEITNITYNIENPSELLVDFRLNNYFSPVLLNLNKAKIMINKNIQITTENIKILKDNLFVVKSKIHFPNFDCTNFDYRNFNVDLEFDIKTDFLYIPLLFITRIKRNVEMKMKQGINKSFYENLKTESKFVDIEGTECLVFSVPLAKVLTFKSNPIHFNIKMNELTVKTEPDIFEKITVSAFEYNDVEKDSCLEIVIKPRENSDQMGNFILDFANEETSLIIKSITSGTRTCKLNYDPFYRVKPVLEQKFRDFMATMENIKFNGSFTFDMKFGVGSNLEAYHYYSYLFLKDKPIEFVGYINRIDILSGTLKLSADKIEVKMEFFSFTEFTRVFLYREPMIGFEIKEGPHFIYKAIKGIKLLTNFSYDYQIYYDNKIVPFFLKTHSFLKEFNLLHKIEEQMDELEEKSRLEITSSTAFRDKNSIQNASKEFQSTFIKIELAEDFLFTIESTKIEGTICVKKTTIYYDSIFDAFNNRIFGELNFNTMIKLTKAVLEPITPLESQITISEILGSDLLIKNGRAILNLHYFLMPTEEYFEGEQIFLNPSNYLDKSLYYKYDAEPDDSDVVISKMKFKLVDFNHLLDIKLQCETSENHTFKDFYDQKYPLKNHKMLIMNEVVFPNCNSLFKTNFRMQDNVDLIRFKTEKVTLKFYLIDGDFFIEIKDPTFLNIEVCNSFMDSTYLNIELDEEKSYFSAFALNTLKYLILDKNSTKIKNKEPVDFEDLYGIEVKVEYSDDFYLIIDSSFTIPAILLNSSKTLELDFPNTFFCAMKSESGFNFINISGNYSKTSQAYKLNFSLKVLFEPEQLENDFAVTFKTAYGKTIKAYPTPLNASEILSFIGGFYPFSLGEYLLKAKEERPKIIIKDIEIEPSENAALLNADVHVEIESAIEAVGKYLPLILDTDRFPTFINFKLDAKDIAICKVNLLGVNLNVHNLSAASNLRIPISYPSKKIKFTENEVFYDLPFETVRVVGDGIECYLKYDFTMESDQVDTFTLSEGKLRLNGLPFEFFKSAFYTYKNKPVYFAPRKNINISILIEIENIDEDNQGEMFESPFCLGICNFVGLMPFSVHLFSFLMGKWVNFDNLISIFLKVPVDIFLDTSESDFDVYMEIYDGSGNLFFTRLTNRLTDWSKRYTGYNLMIPICHHLLTAEEARLFERKPFLLLRVKGVVWKKEFDSFPQYVTLLLGFISGNVSRNILWAISCFSNKTCYNSLEHFLKFTFEKATQTSPRPASFWSSLTSIIIIPLEKKIENFMINRIINNTETRLNLFFYDAMRYERTNQQT
ncbi:hypothetical protein NUSPORA_00330 [Nucleospora cyclopteri]